ncbi:hypothetical protein [Streptomyces sp. NPDC002851]
MRRKLTATLTTLGIAALGAVVPATTATASTAANTGAQAAASCADNWRGATKGYMYAYNGTYCTGYLGKDKNNDGNWGDRYGSFRFGDNNRASSLLHRGTSGYAVKFYNGFRYKGGHICLTKGEKYASALRSDDKFTGGLTANNRISSHKWVPQGQCARFMD